ncbi:MAG: hypothetical protein JW891_11350 [Candidatus Lokiarchaeota archaeon]|nr:hypothetical protein [Candidatus Lokiarchaeota archaeon]
MNNANKIKGKHPPMIRIVGKERRVLKVNALYDLDYLFKNFFLFVLNDKSEKAKTKYYLAILLASQSSDFLSELAKKGMSKSDNFKLIQYSTYPKSSRTSLLLLKECTSLEEYKSTITLLQENRTRFRKKIIALVERVEPQ